MSVYDAVDGSSTGIAKCHIAVAVTEPPLKPIGYKRTFPVLDATGLLGVPGVAQSMLSFSAITTAQLEHRARPSQSRVL